MIPSSTTNQRRVTETADAKSGPTLTTAQRFRPAVSSGVNPIVIDADIVPGKPIKSIEVHCKIKYS